LYYLYKNTSRFGGGDGYAKDVVCGMQVRTADAPAHTEHAGTTYYFCCDGCMHKFQGSPARYAVHAGRRA
jgi:YHS domain-containing protein